jgi:hypothetical protein
MRINHSIIACVSLMFLCSCATDGSIHPHLPADVTINKEAGRGGYLVVTLRLESGEELPFIVDTGTAGTLFNKSLEPKLGKRLGTATYRHWGTQTKSGIYAAPKLYLGSTPLITGSKIVTSDFKQLSARAGRPIMGILGLDCLRHYCIQLDFEAGKMRFLDDDHSDKHNWGKAFPILALNFMDARPAVGENLLGRQGPHSLIDSGYIADGWLMPKFYRQWTNQAVLPAKGETRSPDGRFGGETYPDISLQVEDVESDGIGLPFLARHLVTLDFPMRTLYLKRASIGPLIDDRVESAMQLLKNLKEQGRLPGWLKVDCGALKGATINSPSNSVNFEVLKNGDPSPYHYKIDQASEADPWKLQKAWRTDQNGRTIEEFPVLQEVHPR